MDVIQRGPHREAASGYVAPNGLPVIMQRESSDLEVMCSTSIDMLNQEWNWSSDGRRNEQHQQSE